MAPKSNDKRPVYIVCPRCEINYIAKRDKLCNVCKAELGLADPSILIPEDDDVAFEKLCPVCSVNYIAEDEEMCFLCEKERADSAKTNSEDDADNWTDDLDVIDDEPDEMEISFSELEEEEKNQEELAEDDGPYRDPDDFPYGSDDSDDYDDVYDDDYDDDDDSMDDDF